MRERGLKLKPKKLCHNVVDVVPRAGTWIETCRDASAGSPAPVVPRAGTWIETDERKAFTMGNWVVPRAGTWIETYDTEYVYQRDGGRSPCGNVD